MYNESTGYGNVENYLDDTVSNASPAKLVDMLLNRAVRDLEGAIALLELKNDPRARADAIQLIVHAQAIITELQASLNLKAGGELAINLLRIYEYMQYRLTESVKANSTAGLSEIRSLLKDLQESWESVVSAEANGSLIDIETHGSTAPVTAEQAKAAVAAFLVA